MKIKRLKRIRIGMIVFRVKWNIAHDGGSFDFQEQVIEIGTKSGDETYIFGVLSHEIYEICSEIVLCRYPRRDASGEYMFFLNHKDFTALCEIASGTISEFIE